MVRILDSFCARMVKREEEGLLYSTLCVACYQLCEDVVGVEDGLYSTG